MGTAYLGDNSSLGCDPAGGVSYTSLQVSSATWSKTKDPIETTVLQDTAKYFISGMPNYGPITFEVQATPSDISVLDAAFAADMPTWNLEIPDLSVDVEFEGILTNYEVTGIAPNEKMMVNCEVQVNGTLS